MSACFGSLVGRENSPDSELPDVAGDKRPLGRVLDQMNLIQGIPTERLPGLHNGADPTNLE